MDQSELWDYLEKHKQTYYKKRLAEQESKLQYMRNIPNIFILTGPTGSFTQAVMIELLKTNTELVYGTDVALHTNTIENHKIIIQDIDVNSAIAIKRHFQSKTRLLYLGVSVDSKSNLFDYIIGSSDIVGTVRRITEIINNETILK